MEQKPETNGNPEGEKINSKNIYITIGVIAVIAILAWGLSSMNKSEPVAVDPCAIDIRTTVYEHPATSTPLTRSQAARVMFDRFFSAYTIMPQCVQSALAEYKLVSVGLSEDRVGGFTIPVTFDIRPLHENNGWASTSPEARIDGEWLRGKKGVLSISQNGNLYQLVVF